MTILVTGAAGYIGSHVLLDLLDAGEKVCAIDNFVTGFREAVPGTVPLLEADLSDKDAVTEFMREQNVSSVIHLAASTSLPESFERPLDYYQNNTANSLTLVQAAVAAGVRNVVLSSTAAVYGAPSDNPVTEETPALPQSPYGASKLMAEEIMADAARAHGLGFVALRYFNVAGADPAGRAGHRVDQGSNLIKVACEVAVGKRPKLLIFGDQHETPDGTGIRDYIHVSDLARAHRLALKKLSIGPLPQVINLGRGFGSSVREVVDVFEELTNHFPFEIVDARVGDQPEVVGNSTLAGQVLDWAPEYLELREIAEHALAFERKMRSAK